MAALKRLYAFACFFEYIPPPPTTKLHMHLSTVHTPLLFKLPQKSSFPKRSTQITSKELEGHDLNAIMYTFGMNSDKNLKSENRGNGISNPTKRITPPKWFLTKNKQKETVNQAMVH